MLMYPVEIVVSSAKFGEGAGSRCVVVFRQGSESGQCTHGVYTEGTHVGGGRRGFQNRVTSGRFWVWLTGTAGKDVFATVV